MHLVPGKIESEIREGLIQRGRKYYDMRKQAYRFVGLFILVDGSFCKPC